MCGNRGKRERGVEESVKDEEGRDKNFSPFNRYTKYKLLKRSLFRNIKHNLEYSQKRRESAVFEVMSL